MRKIIITTFVTLNDVMQAPGRSKEDTSGGFAYGGWSFNCWDNSGSKNLIAQKIRRLASKKTLPEQLITHCQ